MVRRDLLTGQFRLGMTGLAPAADTGLGRFADRGGAGACTDAEGFGNLGALCKRRDLGAAELEPRTRFDVDGDALDGRRRIEGRNIGRLAPVDRDRHHRPEPAIAVKRGNDPSIIRLRRGKQRLWRAVVAVQQADQRHRPPDLAAQVIPPAGQVDVKILCCACDRGDHQTHAQHPAFQLDHFR